ncbi:alpha/beta fold hydrolase [Sanguibacter suaedae]|uniref:Alpha/beta hydrolase n=1 Tax=Sanguibacter suaedae TaxID=2795737 RepID=A0A934I6B5_9MICO|nr:alpha/beta fold hydrolase [Sanguibacter suaedae]MBI9114002.1 alpha/beta hydrolase [Sanguibacter suaedae]
MSTNRTHPHPSGPARPAAPAPSEVSEALAATDPAAALVAPAETVSTDGPVDPGVLVRAGEAFGPVPLPAGVDPVTVRTLAGELTALHAAPVGAPRGTVLLVPGFTGSKEDFAPLVPLLAASGWDTWAYSQRGQADSVAPEGVDAYRLEDFAGDVLQVAAVVGAGEPVHLVGHSFGGLVARAAALARPDAFLDVVLLCSGPRGWGSGREQMLALLDDQGSLGVWARDFPDHVDTDPAELEPYVAYRRLRAERTSTDSLRGIVHVLWDADDRTEDLRATGLRTLVAHGETDTAWPQEWQAQMAEVLGGGYEIIAGAGHCPAEEQPAATAEVLDRFWGAPRPR